MYLCRLPEPQDSRPGVTAGRGDLSSLTVGARQTLSRVARFYRLWRHLSCRRTLHLLTLSPCRLVGCR